MINLTILFHVFIVNKNVDEKNYKKILLYLLIPLLTLNLINHENQAFFIRFHLLITLYFFNNKNDSSSSLNIKSLKIYLILLIPIIILLGSSGSFEKLFIINDSISKFDATIYDQFAGNFNLAIGGFVKWHFFYHDVFDFIRLFFCFSLSVFLIYVCFDYLIRNNIIKTDYQYNNSHYLNII